MKPNLADIRRVVTSIVQPMRRGTFVSLLKLRATMKDVIPFGNHDGFVNAAPFGFTSNPAKGVFGYLINLGGDRLAPIVITHQDNKRPEIAQGGSVQYSTTADGQTIKTKIECLPDGQIKITSIPGKAIHLDPSGDIKIGSAGAAEPLVLGTAFTTLYNAHKHIGNLGVPGGPPIIPMGAPEVSAKNFTEI